MSVHDTKMERLIACNKQNRRTKFKYNYYETRHESRLKAIQFPWYDEMSNALGTEIHKVLSLEKTSSVLNLVERFLDYPYSLQFQRLCTFCYCRTCTFGRLRATINSRARVFNNFP